MDPTAGEDRVIIDAVRTLLEQCQGDLEVAEDQIESLKVALTTARRIGAAIGIIMSTRRVSDDEAFEILSQASQRTNRKLRAIADDVIYTGTINA